MSDDQEYRTCSRCGGSGEGMWEGSNCYVCGGSGDIPVYSDEELEDMEARRDAEMERKFDEKRENGALSVIRGIGQMSAQTVRHLMLSPTLAKEWK